MKKIFIYILFIFALPLSAKILISPVDAMKYAYGQESEISKKNILLSSQQAARITEEAKVKLDTKIFRIFKAIKADKVLGFGILVNNKVRSKNAVVIYFITPQSILKGI